VNNPSDAPGCGHANPETASCPPSTFSHRVSPASANCLSPVRPDPQRLSRRQPVRSPGRCSTSTFPLSTTNLHPFRFPQRFASTTLSGRFSTRSAAGILPSIETALLTSNTLIRRRRRSSILVPGIQRPPSITLHKPPECAASSRTSTLLRSARPRPSVFAKSTLTAFP